MKRLRTLLLLVLLLPVTWVAAQQVEPDQDTAAPQVEAVPDNAPEELVFDEQEEDAEQAETEEESTSRFIPTEQISQDLGVSFPVDI